MVMAITEDEDKKLFWFTDRADLAIGKQNMEEETSRESSTQAKRKQTKTNHACSMSA